jgi:RHS repeat-associated protein
VDDDQDTTELKRFYYHTQLVGSVTHLTDPDENVVESYEFDPYGATTILDQSSSTVSASPVGNPFLYTGRRLDEETGLYYYRARHYSPAMKRFVQRDPLEYVDGLNAYAYVSARPTASRDPLGLEVAEPRDVEGRTPHEAFVNAAYATYNTPRDTYGETSIRLVEDVAQRDENEIVLKVVDGAVVPSESGLSRMTCRFNWRVVATGTYVYTITSVSWVNRLVPPKGKKWRASQQNAADSWNERVRLHERMHREEIQYYATNKEKEVTISAEGEATDPDLETARRKARLLRDEDRETKKTAEEGRIGAATAPPKGKKYPYPVIDKNDKFWDEWEKHW